MMLLRDKTQAEALSSTRGTRQRYNASSGVAAMGLRCVQGSIRNSTVRNVIVYGERARPHREALG